jgi:hypothetical protein
MMIDRFAKFAIRRSGRLEINLGQIAAIISKPQSDQPPDRLIA